MKSEKKRTDIRKFNLMLSLRGMLIFSDLTSLFRFQNKIQQSVEGMILQKLANFRNKPRGG